MPGYLQWSEILAPQPMGHVFNDFDVNFSDAILEARPKLATLISQIITQWSIVEFHIANVFSMLVGHKSDSSIIMYSSMSSGGAKVDALKALARHRLSGEDYRLFDASIRAIKPVEKQRNQFAHRVVVSRDDLPDGIILVDSRLAFQATYAKILHNETPAAFSDVLEKLLAKSLIYREGDLKSIVDDIKVAQQIAFSLIGLSSPQHAANAREKLFEFPRVANMYKRLRQSEASLDH